ncbi:unnamed protein product [Tetraodon nigroviridis]|uniref:Endoplasmic reticulum-Golgi intermediate compartment protein n=1 Tax=Tetraodon nigroviridis TaxID=99883 RepID=Q4S7I3_TETNG|nr:unnamed protein product [Tetraodon nigroviridis]
MRRLTKKKALTLVKELDAFPKVPESYVESTASGGTVSLIAFSLMAILAFLEFFVYRDTWMKYEYEVDKDFGSKLRINVDITVADEMPMTLLHIQERLKVEHSLQDLIFKTAMKGAPPPQPQTDDTAASFRACRIHGHLYVNKVAGNFHITVGKYVTSLLGYSVVSLHSIPIGVTLFLLLSRSIPHPRGHAHLAALVSHDSYNFSHRIDHLSFGEDLPGIISPLDGTEKVSADCTAVLSLTPLHRCDFFLPRLFFKMCDFRFSLLANHIFQYFITIVPTKLNTYKVSAETHQYSVTEQDRAINHAAGSHGVSGIFMKYDISSLMVKVTEQHMPLWQFLVRLCGIVGGIFSTTAKCNISVLLHFIKIVVHVFETTVSMIQ